MRLTVCLKNEYEDFIAKKHGDSYGFADIKANTAYFLVDNIMRNMFSFVVLRMERTDIPVECLFDVCLYCLHHDNQSGECKLMVRTDCIIKVYCSGINKVTLHELLHLCGCRGEDLQRDTEILRKFYKERLCPRFKRRTKIVIDDLSEPDLNFTFLFDEAF